MHFNRRCMFLHGSYVKINPLTCVKEGCHKYPGIRVQALPTTLKLVKKMHSTVSF
jgi:hypothetical protein